jgi:hypothetical protein
VPSPEDDLERGVAVDRWPCHCRCLIPLASLARRLAALRCCPRSSKRRGLQQLVRFRGSFTRPQSSLSTLRSPPRDGPRKTRLQRVANLSLRGIGYPQGSFEVSTTYFMASSSPGFAWRNSSSNSRSRLARGRAGRPLGSPLTRGRKALATPWPSRSPSRSSSTSQRDESPLGRRRHCQVCAFW